MSETTDFEKTQKSKQFLKITATENTDLKRNTKIQTILENHNV